MADDPEFAVQKIAHVINQDLDITQSYDVKQVDEHLYTCISQCRDSLVTRKLPRYDEFESGHIWSIIGGMKDTHRSIRKLLMGEQSASAVDALALARVQLENLFTICFMLQSAENVRLHMKNAWKKTYIRFLLHRAEHIHLPRFDEYYNKTALEIVDMLQSPSFVTDDERRTIELQQIASHAGVNEALVPIKGFPTPAKVVKKINEPSLRQMLARLNAEYEYLCSFTHGEGEAIMFRAWADPRSAVHQTHTTSTIEKFYQEHVLEPPVIYSALSGILVATEIAAAIPSDVELRASLIKAWSFLTRSNLMVVSAWESRAKGLLGVIGA
jgi:hypothetical protein